tara:strand:+ start:202 stop:423 length:222 start_codon:yes stop_codon:yes gene_type:complete
VLEVGELVEVDILEVLLVVEQVEAEPSKIGLEELRIYLPHYLLPLPPEVLGEQQLLVVLKVVDMVQKEIQIIP